VALCEAVGVFYGVALGEPSPGRAMVEVLFGLGTCSARSFSEHAGAGDQIAGAGMSS